jgi:integrase
LTTGFLNLTSIKRHGQKLSRATRNKLIDSVNNFLEDLVDLRKLERNPLSGLKRYIQEPERPRGAIDRESLEKFFPPRHDDLIKIWGTPLWACMMLMLYGIGARPGELRALTWEDIDIRKRFIPIRKGIASGTADTIKGTKTGAVKAGFLSPRIIQELDIWRSESRFALDTDFVFTVTGKAPVSIEAIIKAFCRSLARIEQDSPGWKAAPEWSPYWLRHSFGTYQMEVLDEEEIAALMGNGVAVLKRNYQHPDDETLYNSMKKTKDKLDRAREGIV